MTPSAGVVMFMLLGMSAQFVAYDLVWRRERFPLTGDGSAISVSIATLLIDVFCTTIFVYTAHINMTWSTTILSWSFWPFVVGLALQMSSDKIKADFKAVGSAGREDKILDRGPWSLIRNPNYTGFHLWKIAMGVATFGWLPGLIWGAVAIPPTVQKSREAG